MVRYLATRLNGDGTETLVADELPLAGGQVQRALSGPGGMSGSISVEVARLVGQGGVPVFAAGRTAIYAESQHGIILGGGILPVDGVTRQGPGVTLNATGFSGFLDNLPYKGNSNWAAHRMPGEGGAGIQADPADLIRHAWGHVQARPAHNLGMVVDSTVTPVRVGTELREVEFTTGTGEDVSFEAGPVRWTEWGTPDLGKEVDDLAVATPLDYRDHTAWAGDVIAHRLLLGYPQLGSRRHDLSFTVGVNVIAEPSVTAGPTVSDVLVLGAGEGSAMKRGWAHRDPGALGGTVTLTDKTITSNAAANRRAQAYLAAAGGDLIDSVTVTDHANAPIGSWAPGDVIRVLGSGVGWAGDLDVWVRVLSDVTDLQAGTAVLSVTTAGA